MGTCAPCRCALTRPGISTIGIPA
ncbi:hypothetical protein AZZ75_002328 [Klebsiella pneumoniae]|nr:hypothetical protein AZZ75_002328 [Klebsiella pneumoniae]